MLPKQIEWDESVVDLTKVGQGLRLSDDAIDRRARRGWTPALGALVLDNWASRCARRRDLLRGPLSLRTWRDPVTDRPWVMWTVWTVPADAGVSEKELHRAVEGQRYRVRVLRMKPWWITDAG